jgi:hypothetical protein
MAPAAWNAKPPTSSARLAQFTVPGADAASSAEIVVYFFGSGQGGNVEANVARWRSQFSTPDGSPVPEKITRDSTSAFPLTVAEFRGTYRRGVGAGSPDSARTGQALIAVIAETPKGSLFFQMFGPAARVIAERDQFVRFAKSLK